jgi:hypothetical protein
MTLRPILASLSLGLLLGCGTATAGEFAYSCENIAERAALTGFGSAVHQGDDGWFFRANEINQFYPLSESATTFIARLNAALGLHGVRLILMPLPSKATLAPAHATVAAEADNLLYDPGYARVAFSRVVDALKSTGAGVVDILGFMEQNGVEDGDSFYFAQDLHWRPDLAKVAADATAAAIEAEFPGEFPAGKSFVTELRPDLAEIQSSTSRRYLNQLCSPAIKGETLDIYQTVEADQSLDAFLGDESAAAPVSIVGTSFTDERNKFNYDGFLRESLAADVASYALSGGDLDQAIYKWSHADLARSGTRVLVWEMPYVERLEGASGILERTIVPAVVGSCEGNELELAASDYSLTADGTYTFEVPTDIDVTGNGYYLNVGLSDPSPRGFTLTFDYRDGQQDILPIIRNPRVGAVGQIFAELSSEVDGELGTITIRAIEGGSNSGRVTLCRYPDAMQPGVTSGGTGNAQL